MTFALVLNVFNKRFEILGPDGKASVPALSRKIAEFVRLCFSPFRRSRFQLLYQASNGHCTGKTNGQMYVIFHTSDTIALASCVSDYGREVRMNRLLNGFAEIRASVFRAEYQMNYNDAQ